MSQIRSKSDWNIRSTEGWAKERDPRNIIPDFTGRLSTMTIAKGGGEMEIA